MYCVYSIYTWVYGHVVTIEAYLWGLQSLTTSEWKPYMQQHGPVSSTNIATLQHKTNNCPHTLIKGVQASFLNSTLIKFSHDNVLNKTNPFSRLSDTDVCPRTIRQIDKHPTLLLYQALVKLSNVHLFLSPILPRVSGFNSSPHLTANYHTLCDLLEVRLTCSH